VQQKCPDGVHIFPNILKSYSNDSPILALTMVKFGKKKSDFTCDYCRARNPKIDLWAM